MPPLRSLGFADVTSIDTDRRGDRLGQQPWSWANALLPVIALLIAMAVLAWLKFGLGLWQSTLARDAEAIPSAVEHVTLVDRTLAVPAHTISGTGASGGGEDSVHLLLRWPSLAGVPGGAGRPAAHQRRALQLIHVTLAPAIGGIDPAERFGRIYVPNFSDEPADAPVGLTGRILARGSGYGGETLYFEDSAAGGDGFLIRCTSLADRAPLPSMCLRQVMLGDIRLEYRYDRTLLGQWRAVDEALVALVERLKAGD